MTAKLKFWLALAGLYGLLGGFAGLLYLAVWVDLPPAHKQAIIQSFDQPRVETAALILLMALTALGVLFNLLYRRTILATLTMRRQLLITLSANRAYRLQPGGFSELCALAAAINQLADQRDALQHDVAAKISDAKAMVEEERNRLATLMAELAESVIVCNLDGRILLYNNSARQLFQVPGERALVGLGRSIFTVMGSNLIAHGMDRIQLRLRHGLAQLQQQPVANFVTTTSTGQLIKVQMAPVLGASPHVAASAGRPEMQNERAVSGYVLILDNITQTFEMESRRDMMLQALTEGSRASLGNLSAAVENLCDDPEMDAHQRDRFLRVMHDEVGAMRQRLDQNLAQSVDSLKVRWPLEEMLGIDLIQAAQRRIEQRLELPTKTEDIADGLWIKVDSFSLLQGLTYLASRLQDEFNVREVRFRLAQTGRLAHLDLIWTGAVVGTETLIAWELEPMSVGGEDSPLTLREVVERHGGELWFQREKAAFRSYLRILIPVATTPVSAPVAQSQNQIQSRPEYYDFDLFRQIGQTHALDDLLLTQLTYTAFDTETTGLQPSNGDEIIQIGAIRIVNGRLLKNEIFDRLIDPQRAIAPESTQVHGITREMLRGRPTIDAILPEFHAFCEETVLVGHNAAFDMRFLQLKEKATGITFRQPLLDTLLLSAVIHPDQQSHGLEAIAGRLGIDMTGRHTALGDAIVTGEVFLRMIPLLAEQGIRTLREARDASERTYYAKIDY
ncbi:MAG: exonuclease domain-containing protein [Burkholderiales bacterium]